MLLPLAETPLVRVWAFSHHGRVAGDPGEEVFLRPTMVFTSAGRWQVTSAAGRGVASPARGGPRQPRPGLPLPPRPRLHRPPWSWSSARPGGRFRPGWRRWTTPCTGCRASSARARSSSAVREHIERHFADPGLSLAALAGVAGWSPSHLIRAFRAATGQSPHRWLPQRRLDEACRLLDLGQHSVTEICWLAGFGSLSHFMTTFRRETGVSPGAFRRRAGSDFPQARGEPPG